MLEEHRSSPGLLPALLGQEAMRRLRDAHTAHNLKPRQFQILGLLHDHETEDALFASLDDDQREHLRTLLLALRDGLATEPERACTAETEAGR